MEKTYHQNLEILLDIVISNGASDLHLGEGRHPFIRVNGELIPVVQYPELTKEDISGIIGSMVTHENLSKLSRLEEIDFAYNHQDKVRFRGNAYIQSGVRRVDDDAARGRSDRGAARRRGDRG
jgi:twitching motility protein PilT